jgi:hypothetical protein
VTHLAALEIGGSNGMVNLITGSSKYMDLPIIDGDFMGRAYPTGWQTTPNVYDKGDRAEMLLPAAMCSGDGSTIVRVPFPSTDLAISHYRLEYIADVCQFMTKVKHYLDQDAILRAACVEMGTHAGAASRPLTREECEGCMVKNTVSQAWRLGRSVALANKSANIGNIGPILVDALGGPQASRVLFSGKIVEVNRRIFKGHTIGEIVVKAVAAEDEDGEGKERFEGTVTSELAVMPANVERKGRVSSTLLAFRDIYIVLTYSSIQERKFIRRTRIERRKEGEFGIPPCLPFPPVTARKSE